MWIRKEGYIDGNKLTVESMLRAKHELPHLCYRTSQAKGLSFGFQSSLKTIAELPFSWCLVGAYFAPLVVESALAMTRLLKKPSFHIKNGPWQSTAIDFMFIF